MQPPFQPIACTLRTKRAQCRDSRACLVFDTAATVLFRVACITCARLTLVDWRRVLCRHVSLHSVVYAPLGGEDTQTLCGGAA